MVEILMAQKLAWLKLIVEFGILLGLTTALPTNENGGLLEPRKGCQPNNCLRALRSFGNSHAATSFCQSYLPIGSYTTVVTTIVIYESLQQFSPVITTDFTTMDTYTRFITIGLGIPIFGFPPSPTLTPTATAVTPALTPAPTPTFPAFMSACGFEEKKISSACGCLVSSVTTVLQVENVYVEDVFPYDGPPFPFKEKNKRDGDGA